MTPDERRAQRRAYNNSEAGKAAKTKWLSKAENREQANARSRAWYHANKGRSRARQRAAHGIVDAPAEQPPPGPCAICTRVKPLVCDHDYETGAVRGWLCRTCNSFIGQTSNEAVTRAERTLAYIKKAS